MAGKPPRIKPRVDDLLFGEETESLEAPRQRFGQRQGRRAQINKMERTALMREAERQAAGDIQSLPIGQVIQVFSLYCHVKGPEGMRLCVVRKTLNKLIDCSIVVGDEVRFRDADTVSQIPGEPFKEAVIEELLPRRTMLTRADSFQEARQQPIVANAQQVLIVASVVLPDVKWGLIDRMLVAARAGGLEPMVCLNKVDLAEDMKSADEVLDHYAAMGIQCAKISATTDIGLGAIRDWLKDKMTVLSGHSGVGKSTLIAAIQPGLDIRIGAISNYTAKGRHTTSSARRYELDAGGCVIDTPGVKMFGLWGVTRENLPEFFPDVAGGDAPQWRLESYQRILESLAG